MDSFRHRDRGSFIGWIDVRCSGGILRSIGARRMRTSLLVSNTLENEISIDRGFPCQMQKDEVAHECCQTENAHQGARVQRQGDEVEFASLATDGDDQSKAVRFRQRSYVGLIAFPMVGKTKVEANRECLIAVRGVEPGERILRFTRTDMPIQIAIPVEFDAYDTAVAQHQFAFVIVFLRFVDDVIKAEYRTILVGGRMENAGPQILHHVFVLDVEHGIFDEILDEDREIEDLVDDDGRAEIVFHGTPA